VLNIFVHCLFTAVDCLGSVEVLKVGILVKLDICCCFLESIDKLKRFI
jgi:hypothetical protein